MPRLGSGRSGGRRRPASLLLVVLMAAVVLLAAACSSTGPATGRSFDGTGEGGYPRPIRRPGPSSGGSSRRRPICPCPARRSAPTSTRPSSPRSARPCSTRGCTQWSVVRLLSIQVSEPSALDRYRLHQRRALAGSGCAHRRQPGSDQRAENRPGHHRADARHLGQASMPPSARSPPRSACSSPTSATARASRYTASTPPPRRRSARPSSSTYSTRWAMPWPRARSAGTSC